MNSPPFGRAPLAAGPAWNPDGSIKEVWARWFVSIGENVLDGATQEDIVGAAAILGGSRGASAESVMITALGLLTAIPPSPPNAPVRAADVATLIQPPHVSDNPLAMLLQRPTSSLGRNQILICTQATFPILAGVPAGSFIYVTDYAHLIYFDGTTPSFVGDNPGRVSAFLIAPGTGWKLCDGTGTFYLNADGTITAVTVPDYVTTAVYMKLGAAATGVPAAAVAPTVAVVPFTPAGTLNSPTFTGIAMPLTTVSVGGAGTSVINTIDASSVTITPRGNVAAPVFTGTLASPTAVAGTNGEPRNSAHLPYFRR